MQKEGKVYLNKDGIVACKRREENPVQKQRDSVAATIRQNFFIQVARSDGPSGNRQSIPEDPEAL